MMSPRQRAAPSRNWVIKVEFAIAACLNGKNLIIEQSPPTPGQICLFTSSEGIMKVGRYRLSTMSSKGAAVDSFTLPDVKSSSGRFKPFLPKGKARIRSMSKVCICKGQQRPGWTTGMFKPFLAKDKARIRSMSKVCTCKGH